MNNSVILKGNDENEIRLLLDIFTWERKKKNEKKKQKRKRTQKKNAKTQKTKTHIK